MLEFWRLTMRVVTSPSNSEVTPGVNDNKVSKSKISSPSAPGSLPAVVAVKFRLRVPVRRLSSRAVIVNGADVSCPSPMVILAGNWTTPGRSTESEIASA